MKSKLITSPVRVVDVVRDDFYLDISSDWRRRAKELQARRWEKIRQREERSYRHDRYSPG